jgi:ADP-heptose:LPS heptosyltransferase
MLGATAGGIRLRNRLRRHSDHEAERILVLEPFGLGDLISFEPLVESLRAAKREVVVCSKPEWRALFPPGEGLHWVDVLLPWATHNERAKYRFTSYFQRPWHESLRRMRDFGRSQVGLDTRGDIRSVLVLQLAGCRRVVSLSTYLGSNVRVPTSAAELVPFTPQLRRWELNLRFLEPLGVKIDLGSVHPPYFVHLARRSPAQRVVGFMPVAPWRGKLWMPERWRELARHLQKANGEVRVFCGPGQRQVAAEQVGAGLRIIECASLESWVRELQPCAALVTLDSGPMHLADALGIPVVALFGQGWLPFWAPSGQFSRVIAHQEDPDFAVCHPIDANIAMGQKYMNRIQTDEVFATLQEVLTKVQVSPTEQATHEA